MKKKTALIVSLALIIVCLIGGTIAFLTDKTDTVTNTFTIGKVDIDLTETKPGENGGTAQMTPGCDIEKDPTVTVDADSEDCYVYIKIEDTNASDYLTWAIADGWTQGDGTDIPDNVYYRAYTKGSGATYSVLADDKVTVKTDITGIANGVTPTLAFTAYAIQKDATSITSPAIGWAELNP